MQRGFTPILIVLLIALGIGGYFIYTKYPNNQIKPKSNNISTPKPTSNQSDTNPIQNKVVGIDNWQTFTPNSSYFSFHFIFKYPSSWKVEDLKDRPGYKIYDPSSVYTTYSPYTPNGAIVYKHFLRISQENNPDLQNTFYSSHPELYQNLKQYQRDQIKILTYNNQGGYATVEMSDGKTRLFIETAIKDINDQSIESQIISTISFK